MNIFRFVSYEFSDGEAVFRYGDESHQYVEKVQFAISEHRYNQAALERALFLAFLLIGTSYYKAFPTRSVAFDQGKIDSWQAEFLNHVYQEGLSQYAYENQLAREDLVAFVATVEKQEEAVEYSGSGILSLQSGGKDSLLVATGLKMRGVDYSPWYVASGDRYPLLLDELGAPVLVARRVIDREALRDAIKSGGLNGHVPVTYIVQSLALVQAVLLGKDTVLSAIAHEGDEPHAWIGDLPVNHQWSKTWAAEQLFAEYVMRYVSTDLKIGSPLRGLSELKVAELFVKYAWNDFGQKFSSCNVANYRQLTDNTKLSWCGDCPKCANSYLLFAPFVEQDELRQRLGGDLFAKRSLARTFKGLLGVDGVIKPFECVGEVEELRSAYHMALTRGYTKLTFEVPQSNFDKDALYPVQRWVDKEGYLAF